MKTPSSKFSFYFFLFFGVRLKKEKLGQFVTSMCQKGIVTRKNKIKVQSNQTSNDGLSKKIHVDFIT